MQKIIDNIDKAIKNGKQKAKNNEPHTHIIVYKDGTNISCLKSNCWEYENDPDWLATIESPTKNLEIGRFELYQSDFTSGMIWIDNQGEGAEFDQKLLESHIAEFYKKHF